MIQNYTPRESREVTEYRVEFYYDANSGMSYPCDEHGNILRDQMAAAAISNYEDDLRHPERYPYCFNAVHKFTHRVSEPAKGTCHCGERIELYSQYMGACECPKCGRWYNIFGQELNPPKTWRDGDDW